VESGEKARILDRKRNEGSKSRDAKINEADKFDDLVKSLLERHPGESRGPEHLEITGFRLSPE